MPDKAVEHPLTVLPIGWSRLRDLISPDGVTLFAYKYRNELTVLASVRVEQDGKRWLHVSCAGQDTIPSWAELKDIKNMFMGKNVVALQVLPASDKYINLHPNVLHLWHCLDGDVTPDFAHEGLI